jgi:uncharacterized protein DUF417
MYACGSDRPRRPRSEQRDAQGPTSPSILADRLYCRAGSRGLHCASIEVSARALPDVTAGARMPEAVTFWAVAALMAMATTQKLESRSVPQLNSLQPPKWADRLDALGAGVLRYGVVLLLLLFGAMKFTVMEAEGIRPLVEHSPLLAWTYGWFGARTGSALIGVVELTAALLMCARR